MRCFVYVMSCHICVQVVMDVALEAPYFVPLPMAPAQGLILSDSGFLVSTRPTPAIHTLCPQTKRPRTLPPPFDTALLSGDEYEASEQFKRENIYPEVVKQWGAEGSVLTDWLAFYANRYYCIPADTEAADAGVVEGASRASLPQYEEFWTQLLHTVRTDPVRVQAEQTRWDRDLARRLRFIDQINNATQVRNEAQKLYAYNITATNGKGWHSGKDKAVKPVSFEYTEFLPTGMSIAYTVYSRLPPGSDAVRAMRVLASLVVSGEVGADWDCDRVLRYVESRGGLPWIYTQRIHPLIA